jgi:peptidoglycan hydrolase-like protein with peptidoglycan-binding domain
LTPVATPVSPSGDLEALPPSGPFRPSPTEIQTALKNAGFYSGSIDGKIGPKTKAAIEEFQKSKGLTADGKVGPKTWQALGAYLTKASSAAPAGQ